VANEGDCGVIAKGMPVPGGTEGSIGSRGTLGLVEGMRASGADAIWIAAVVASGKWSSDPADEAENPVGVTAGEGGGTAHRGGRMESSGCGRKPSTCCAGWGCPATTLSPLRSHSFSARRRSSSRIMAAMEVFSLVMVVTSTLRVCGGCAGVPWKIGGSSEIAAPCSRDIRG